MTETDHPGWSVERLLLIATFICSVLAFTFGVGVNWARLTQQESEIAALKATTVPRDLYAADQRYLAESINRLTVSLDKMQTEREQGR